MIPVIATYVLSLLSGAGAKLTDAIVDEGIKIKKDKLVGIAYGLLGAIVALQGEPFATVSIAVAVSLLLIGKIDAPAHQLAVAAMFTLLAIAGFPQVNVAIFALLIAASVFDELANDYSDRNKEKLPKLLRTFLEWRLTLEITAFAASLYTGVWEYFFTILSFDLGYHAVSLWAKKQTVQEIEGQHLVLDLFNASHTKLDDEKTVRRFLAELPDALKMQKISKVIVQHFKSDKDYGVSGFVLIAESHISVHTFPSRRLAQIDIFSCKPFNTRKVEQLAMNAFRAKNKRVRVLSRGTEWPHDVENAKKLALKQRASIG
ncbi:MAG TPA: adenosylmethionine decarboxylase [Candidatus Norongarragalinales archaeon]|jgi:S-adenosylmethionine decarboxylase|nr:adenosylmethionine decarboxylase [Candidatus Norongarragalinales archaeon]